jgi:hypothetical protein
MVTELLRQPASSMLCVALIVCGAVCCPLPLLRAEEEPVDYIRDIRPILSNRCYACHGPDANARKADMRLDKRESALESAIQPGDTAGSELVRRITNADPELRMPPVDSNKVAITVAEADLIRRWIDQGAKYDTHWSFVKPVQPAVPQFSDVDGDLHPIDAFIRQRLEREGLTASPEADRRTLIRRLSFDLTGLPPSPEQVRAFLADTSPDAYEKVVDQLLDSRHYGERMAIYWLDVVRYADTNGIHNDVHAEHDSFRDYVIKAFNDNLPYDRFVIEQLAGDLLPEATDLQKIASGFNRLNMTTEEGGAQPKEYTAIYAADRVRNTGSIFMGVTIGCAQCHDHKFDPFTTKDFYSFASFFADIQETAVGKQQPISVSRIAHDEAEAERIRQLREKLAAAQKLVDTATPELELAQKEWEPEAHEQAMQTPSLSTWSSLGPLVVDDAAAAFITAFVDETSDNIDPAVTYQEGQLSWQEQKTWDDGKVHTLNGENCANYVMRTIHAHVDVPLELSLGSDDGIKVWLNGQLVFDKEVFRSVGEDQDRITVQLHQGDNQLLIKVVNGTGGHGFYFNPLFNRDIPSGIADILRMAPEERGDEKRQELAIYFRSVTPLLAPEREELDKLKAEGERLQVEMTILVSQSVEPRMVRILPRGNWLDDSGELVQPAPPEFLGDWEVADRRATRKDLADWLISPENPLTARVFVNRLWKLVYGHGLVRSMDDIGAQGETPNHPELLDWLASTFIESGWDIKKMMQLLVMSSTYRQSSLVDPQLAERDPRNDLYARQSRFRLDAEMVRDNALAASDLLVRKVGGPSVKPYQPAGYWANLYFPAREWEHGKGEDLYRRGLYTYWCRTFLHPALLAFDAPTREECTVQRPRSNTPAAALVLLNDPSFVEAARALAAMIMRESESDLLGGLIFAFDRVLNRAPSEDEIQILTALHDKHLQSYQQDQEAAVATQTVGASPPSEDLDPAQLAAWTSVARTMLNLHETIMRE